MTYKIWEGFCLCGKEGQFPEGARPVSAPFAPLVILIHEESVDARGIYPISSPVELRQPAGPEALLPPSGVCDLPEELFPIIAADGATVLNTAYARSFAVLKAWRGAKKSGLRVTLVGLGDVGGTVLTGLKLLGREIAEIALYDPNEAVCRRYEMELNQILPPEPGMPVPRVTICREEELFECDLFLFTASRGVPAVGSGVRDVRMVQFEANRALLAPYAEMARRSGFTGLFCQISDPVDHLSREVFLSSSWNGEKYDLAGLLPEQVQGFGLGVMAARAAYYAEKEGIDFSNGRMYGPHGEGLIAANCPDEGYDDAASRRLTELAAGANLQVRELGFKPYIAPGLSSAAISILRLLRGQEHYGAIPMDGVYFGCAHRFTSAGPVPVREELSPALLARLRDTHRMLKEFDAG